jgi:hypothetical protein
MAVIFCMGQLNDLNEPQKWRSPTGIRSTGKMLMMDNFFLWNFIRVRRKHENQNL